MYWADPKRHHGLIATSVCLPSKEASRPATVCDTASVTRSAEDHTPQVLIIMTITPVSAERPQMYLKRIRIESHTLRDQHEQWEERIADACDEICWQLEALQSRMRNLEPASALRVIGNP